MALNVRIGINPISWSNDDLPELGGETPLETALSEGAEIGYQGFELGNKFPREPAALKAKLAEFKVACVSGWYSGHLAVSDLATEIANCQAHMDKLAFNGCRVVVYGEVGGSIQGQIQTPLFKRPRFLTSRDWQAYADRLNQFGQHLKKTYGLTLAYHHHMGAFVQAGEDIDQLMALTDGEHVGLLFDTGHAWFGGVEDVAGLLQKHIHRVVHFHCKDVRKSVIAKARNENWSFLQSVLNGAFTVPGDGGIDFAPIMAVLNQANYQGWLVVEAEQDPAVAPSYDYAKKGYNTIRSLVDHYQGR
ncbi:MAG: myo-inosose-2 dehydratase [Candidatus Pacebacteria bacterium]|nr:myo-inosose-2 dehydratase [Candidatus Paceibacterota bacterium]